jgi:pyruvate/2-oxoglutarate dehydrogenase complex dihydrolipoamide dehydrogenase (E3) component
MSPTDLVVIGAGAAGLAAAREGVRRGLTTVLMADGPPGGDCTFTGCVPSKTLLAAAARGEPGADALAGVRATVARIAATETAEVLRGEGVDVRTGRAAFVGPRLVGVDGDDPLRAPRVVIATGSAPRLPGIPGLAAVEPLTTDTVFALDDAPESMAVIGGGPAGCELAQAFARLGVAVTLVEAAPRLLPGEEPDAGAVLRRALARDGVDVRLGVAIGGARRADDGTVRLTGTGLDVRAARVLVTAGRRPDTDRLGLPAAGITTSAEGAVVVDGSLATSALGVWAAGDVTGLEARTHTADEMGRVAAANAALPRRRRRRVDLASAPRVVFTEPEVAAVGLTEDAAARRGTAWVGEIAMSGVDRAITAGREDGFVRLVAGTPGALALAAGPARVVTDGLGRLGGGRVLGATIVADRAGEMIAEVALVMRIGALTGRLAQTVHAYPTWTLAVRQAAARLARRGGGARPARLDADPTPSPSAPRRSDALDDPPTARAARPTPP